MTTDNLKKEINEEIDAKDAYSEEGSLKTLLSGRRNVAFIVVNDQLRKLLEKRKFHIILVRPCDNRLSWWSIVHNSDGRENAIRLYKIAREKHGYIGDNTPSEAMEIGRILGYSENSIREYIYDRYRIKPPFLDDNPNNYDDLHEKIGLPYLNEEKLNENYQFQKITDLINKMGII